MDYVLAVAGQRGHCKHMPKLAIQIRLAGDKFQLERKCQAVVVAKVELHLEVHQSANFPKALCFEAANGGDGYYYDDDDDDKLVYCLKR